MLFPPIYNTANTVQGRVEKVQELLPAVLSGQGLLENCLCHETL